MRTPNLNEVLKKVVFHTKQLLYRYNARKPTHL